MSKLRRHSKRNQKGASYQVAGTFPVQPLGEKEGATMKAKKQDSNMPIGELTKIKDVLPPPEELAVPEDTIKVTLLLSKASVKFFKEQAFHHHTKYQRMIRAIVDCYAEEYAGRK